MTARRAILATLALSVLIFLFRSWRQSQPPVPSAPAARLTEPPPPRPGAVANGASAEPRSTLADALNSPATDVRADLRLISDVLGTFRTNFPQDGNPTGTNAEITAALTGRNRLRLALIPGDHPAINREGELCDRWGTPFFFHNESATRTEIRSAGPDRRLWTDDDATFAP